MCATYGSRNTENLKMCNVITDPKTLSKEQYQKSKDTTQNIYYKAYLKQMNTSCKISRNAMQKEKKKERKTTTTSHSAYNFSC